MSEALDRAIEALAGASEDEVAAVTAAVGFASSPSFAAGIALPSTAGPWRRLTEVEWV